MKQEWLPVHVKLHVCMSCMYVCMSCMYKINTRLIVSKRTQMESVQKFVVLARWTKLFNLLTCG